jgi:hypothetical protein
MYPRKAISYGDIIPDSDFTSPEFYVKLLS